MSAAILLGDLTLIASEQEFAGALALQPLVRAERARTVFDLMRTEVTVGQYLDVLAQALPWGDDPAADEARAREVIRAKAARYSVEHPIVLGAALADADEEELQGCRTLGLPLGEAFQLRDDLLGVFGDPRTTGKPSGDDLREGKRTVLTARAVARARAVSDETTVELLRTRLGDRALTDADVVVLATAIRDTGAPDDVEELIDDLAGRAFALMDRAAVGRAGPQPADRARPRRGRPARLSRLRRSAGRRAPSELRGRPAPDLGLAAHAQGLDRCARQGVVGREEPLDRCLVGEPGVREDCQRPLQRGEDRPGLVRVGRRRLRRVGQVPGHEEGRGDDEDAGVAAPDADDAALLHDPAHLRGVEAEPVGNIRDGEPLVDQLAEGLFEIVHPTRVRIRELHPGNSSERFPHLEYSDTFEFRHISNTGNIRSLPHHEVGTMSLHNITARSVATGTGATLALAVVGVTAAAGAAHADDSYTVRTGDTVSHIATRSGTTVAAIVRANSLADVSRIRIGQVLTIPTASSAATPRRAVRAAATYTVVPGDTVGRIAAKHGTTVAAVVAANGLDSRAFIRIGQTLSVPGAVGPAAAAPAPAAVAQAAGSVSYTVRSGDTVTAIAAKHGATVAAVVAANGLDSRAFIRIGQTLTVPVPASAASVGNTFAGRTYADSVVAAANANLAALRSSPTPSKADMQAKIAATARALGVDPALAQAVAFQESGFNHAVVSPANAIGTMQVIPSSGTVGLGPGGPPAQPGEPGRQRDRGRRHPARARRRRTGPARPRSPATTRARPP